MKLLPFNFVPVDDEAVFISNTGGFSEYLSRDSFLEFVEDRSIKDETLKQVLTSKLFVSDDENYSTAKIALASSTSKRLTSELRFNPIFMIVPTLRCDHTCTYCQVSRANVGASEFDLDSSLVPKIVSTIRDLGTAPYKIEIQGGEPLLRFDIIQDIYGSALQILGSDSFELVIATSLSLLNEEILEWANSRHVHFSTSLDGTKEIHDKNRILPKESSYSQLKRGVEAIQSRLGNDKVSAVTTVTDSLLSMPDKLIEAHLDLGLKDLFVRPISPYGFANKGQLNNYSTSEYMRFYEKLFDELLIQWSRGNTLIEHSASIHLKRIFTPGFNSYADLKSPSGVLLNSLLFNYDGRIYGSDELRMLQRIHGDQDFSLGHVNAPDFVSSELYGQIISSSFNSVLPGCNTCAYQPFCGADPCNEISIQGEYIGDKTRSRFCGYHKGMFDFLVKRWFECSDSRSMLEEWVNA
ncbi:His-Xaa-Ser system radical SAM maturase HxsB [Bacterioplanoides sp.]|uniref:His-Xaa-Ser system radical SAM maturase HxsB n=1 Tax=Bacterioplanoides sp. TaxID=2066072 RepID=UPI003B5CDDF0